MMRRFIAAGICVGLLALGPLPLSVCAMLASLPADCVSPVPVSDHCQQTAARKSQVGISAAQNCCQLASPAGDAVATAKKTESPQLAQATPASAETAPVMPAAVFAAPASPLLACPSERQSRLCVFLI